MGTRPTLKQISEDISDQFQSTFSVVSENTLSNMMGFPGDFEHLTGIVRRYIPGAELEFIKSNIFKGDYDMYFIHLKESSEKHSSGI